MCSEMFINRPKSAECALSMVLLGVAMATLDGNACRIHEILVLVFNRETHGCCKE